MKPKRTLERWLKGKGIDFANCDVIIVEKVEQKESTLKLRASFIKEFYNHKFTQR